MQFCNKFTCMYSLFIIFSSDTLLMFVCSAVSEIHFYGSWNYSLFIYKIYTNESNIIFCITHKSKFHFYCYFFVFSKACYLIVVKIFYMAIKSIPWTKNWIWNWNSIIFFMLLFHVFFQRIFKKILKGTFVKDILRHYIFTVKLSYKSQPFWLTVFKK